MTLTIDRNRVAQTEARIKADEAAGDIAVMEPYEAVVTQIRYLEAVAEYLPQSAEVRELRHGLADLFLLVERLEAQP